MRYVFTEFGHSDRTWEVLQELRNHFRQESFELGTSNSIFVKSYSEETRRECREFCLGYQAAKKW
jgi:hypothetical protein